MKRAWRICKSKLADESGDSLVESLTAILIATLATVLLATMVMAATSVSSSSQRALQATYDDESAVASGNYVAEGTLTVTMPGQAPLSLKVNMQTRTQFSKYDTVNGLVRYEYDPSGYPEES